MMLIKIAFVMLMLKCYIYLLHYLLVNCSQERIHDAGIKPLTVAGKCFMFDISIFLDLFLVLISFPYNILFFGILSYLGLLQNPLNIG